MTINYAHTVGDSTLNNFWWMLNSNGSNETQANQDSVEGQLQNRLNIEGSSTYQVIRHSFDGFTTNEVLTGGHVGRVLGIRPNISNTEKQKTYLKDRNINPISESYFVNPLKDFKEFVNKNPKARHYVVISVGGNDFRERLGNPIAMLREIPHIHERYLQILKEVNSLKDKDIRPILVFQYRLDAHHDSYYIYTILKVIGVFFTALQSFSLFVLGTSAMALLAKKINPYLGLALFLTSTLVLTLSRKILPLKVTKGALMGQQVGMAALGGLLETFYRPILAQAKKDGIPILDLPNTFNPHDSSLYISQIEPSKKGGQLIAEGINHIIKHHDFSSSKSILYSKKESNPEFTAVENPGSSGWSVAYPAI